MASKKTLEINPYHPIISELAKKSKDAPEDEATKELAWILYDSSLITAGFDIDDQVEFNTIMKRMLHCELHEYPLNNSISSMCTLAHHFVCNRALSATGC